jgi:ribosomal protein S18 acetylase RimI-like enzyme
MNVEIVPLTTDHMLALAPRLRPMDALEVQCMAPDQPVHEALADAAKGSFRGRAGFLDGDLVACWGVAARTPFAVEGTPWLLATDALERPEARRAFVRHGRAERNNLVAGFQRLWNFVHEDNRVAIRWLRHMGFRFPGICQHLMGEPFLYFEMEN